MVHRFEFCEICVENLNLFTHERKFYSQLSLKRHLELGDSDDKSFKGGYLQCTLLVSTCRLNSCVFLLHCIYKSLQCLGHMHRDAQSFKMYHLSRNECTYIVTFFIDMMKFKDRVCVYMKSITFLEICFLQLQVIQNVCFVKNVS